MAKRMSISGSLSAMVVFSLLFSWNLTAQVSGGTIEGTVGDPSGAILPDAKVTVRNLGTSVSHDVTTNGAGRYSVPSLLPGTYSVTVTALGFRTQRKTGAELTVGAVVDLSFTMAVGSQTQEIEVSTALTTVELNTSELSGVVGEKRITQLPLNGRDWTQLATLEPGVAAIRSENSVGNRVQQGEGQQMSISGGRPWQNNYRLDGISINDYANGAPGSALGANLGVDAIKEFSVVSSGYPAEYGRSSGGIINAVTRSGTNSFHGDVYEFIRNSAADSRKFLDGPKIPEFKRNQFGGSIGGPIRKNRTFFFGDYEAIRQNLGNTQNSRVPTAAARAGNLSSGTVKVDPGVLKFVNAFYPLPNGALDASGDTGIYSFAAPFLSSENFVTAKVDHRLTARDSIDATYLYDASQSTQPDEMNNKLTGYAVHRDVATVEEDHTFNSQFLNAARFGLNRVIAQEGLTTPITPASSDITLGSQPGNQAAQVSVPSLVAFTGGINGDSQHFYNYNSFQENDDAFLTRGVHTFKFGFSVERIQDNEFAVAGPNGTFTFGSLPNFLTNNPSQFQGVLPGGKSERGIRSTIFGAYLQDDWRWRPNLTLNIGVRYEMSSVPNENHGHLSVLKNIGDAAPHLGSPFFSNPTRLNFAPRIGLSWDPTNTGKTAIRAGFGMFDVLPLPYLFELETEFSSPYYAQGAINHLPAGTFPTGAYALIAGSPKTLRAGYVQQKPPRNYVMHWNLNVQRQFTPTLTGLVAYVGSHGVHQATPSDDLNSVVPTLTSAGLLFPLNGAKVNPNFGRISGVQWIGSSAYNALEGKLTQNMTHGFQLQAAYTWSKSMDTSSTSVGTDAFGNSLINPQVFYPGLNRSVSDFDIRQNLLINTVWAIGGPASATARSLKAAVVGGWEIGTILQASSGIPFNAILGGDPTNQQTSGVEDLPNRAPGGGCKNLVNSGQPLNYIKLQCFAFPTPGVYGNIGRNALTGPSLLSMDASLNKTTYIAEGLSVQFRLEAFNVINHTNYAPPIDNQIVLDDTGGQVPGAGQIDATQTPARQLQAAVKFIF
jgi:hypothetical protein